MDRSDGVTQRKSGINSNPRDLTNEYISHDGKRKVPDGLRSFLNLDAQITEQFTAFMRNKFPNVTKSETKFMEVCFTDSK